MNNARYHERNKKNISFFAKSNESMAKEITLLSNGKMLGQLPSVVPQKATGP